MVVKIIVAIIVASIVTISSIDHNSYLVMSL